MSKKITFTKSALERIQPNTKQESYQDLTVRGLILLCYPSGGKTFFVYRRINGKPERIKLGVFPQMTVEQARKAAESVNGQIAKDQNPAAAKRILKAEPTLLEVFDAFVLKKRNRAGKPLSDVTKLGYKGLLDNQLASIASLRLSQINPEKLRSIKIASDAQNNRARALISSIFNWAESEGLTDLPNPAKAIKNRFIKSRDRFLQPDELPRFFAAVQSSRLRDFFLLALFTGARKSNIQSMKWEDVNLREAVWIIPKTKNGESQRVALSTEAVQILQERKQQKIVNAVWVFPGAGKTGHLVEPKRAWQALMKDAGLEEDLRIHDLRRTLGSWQARAGASLTIIGKSLGHKSQQATAIYSRLDLDPVRASVEQATAAMIEAGKAQG
jgi:integrase